MTLPMVSDTRQRAEEVSDGSSVVGGPLKGYHHETYVVALPGGTRIVKFREPREEILWFDRRCFNSEEELLRALQGRITRIPAIHDVEGMGMQVFIVGRTLRAPAWPGRKVSEVVFRQILDLFREMAAITPEMLSVERRCEEDDRPKDGDTAGFLQRLVVFTEEQVYRKNQARFGSLFRVLGVDGNSLARIREDAQEMTERPFCLLHADLHRKNFVVDPSNQLWTIDWELAMLGDPLYDLATHLHLMCYPADQERRMIEEWRRVVELIRPGSAQGMEKDLPLLLDFKRAQSVFTDVIRMSLALRDGARLKWAGLPGTAMRLRRVLRRAAGPLGLAVVPGLVGIMFAIVRWHRTDTA